MTAAMFIRERPLAHHSRSFPPQSLYFFTTRLFSLFAQSFADRTAAALRLVHFVSGIERGGTTTSVKFDQVMAEKLVIGCITGNLTIAEFRNRCRRPPLAGRVVRCVGGTLPQIKFVQKPTMDHLAKFQNCVVKTIYPHSHLFR
ncbi:uncharacterized protein [Dermacentor albipictus]|uniref:uncharacterized protein isoform X1 n=1 Tax=Dermacentor albipictus TaxID=60249 RepID=UPI0038FCDBA7